MKTDGSDNAFQEGMFGKTNTLTKREYFSLMLFQSLINAHYTVPLGPNEAEASDTEVARLAVQQADILLAVLNGK